MYGDKHPPDDVRDIFHDLKTRWRTTWNRWAAVSPTEWTLPVQCGVAVFVGVVGLVLAWSTWWLVGLPVWATLTNDLDVERQALARASEAARRLPELSIRLRDAQAETIAWHRLLPVAAPTAKDDIAASTHVSRNALVEAGAEAVSVEAPGALGDEAPSNAIDDTQSAWRTDLEQHVARANLILEFARPGPSETSGEFEIERAEMRVRGPVANLLGWLGEIDAMPRHLAVERLSLQGPRMVHMAHMARGAAMPGTAGISGTSHTASGSGANVVHPDTVEATLTVMVSAYRWRRPAGTQRQVGVLAALADRPWPALPEPPARWQMPADTIDVFRTPLTRRAAQDAVTIAASATSSGAASVDDMTPIGSMRSGSRYLSLRRSGPTGLTATWRDDASLAGKARSERGDATVDVTLHGVEAADALRAFARLTGRSVVIGERVTGRLDMEVLGVSAATAFDVMIRSAGLGVQSVSGVDWIAPRADLLADEQTQLEAAAKREALLPLSARRFTLNYPRAQALREIILGDKDSKGQRLLSARGSLIADPRTNQLFVTDLPEKLDALASFIARIDVPVRQVLIEARIVEADDRFSESLGVRLAGRQGGAGASEGRPPTVPDAGEFRLAPAATRAIGGAGLPDEHRGDAKAPGSAIDVGLPAAALAGVVPPSLAITLFGRSASRFLQLELSALETSGRGRVVSRPRVVTADKVQALIEQGTELPYQTRSGPRGATSVQFRKATLRLEVTPLITPDGQVILDVDVRKDSVGQSVAEGFAVDTRRVRTQVQVENGGTVAIGGIYQEVRRDSRAAVPWLGEVPVLGALFRNRANEDRRTELLVFLTPSVVPEGNTGIDAADGAGSLESGAPARDGPAPDPSRLPGAMAAETPDTGSRPHPDDLPRAHPRLIGVFPEATRSARPTQIPVSSGIGTQISAIYAGKRNTCRTDGGGQDHGWTRSRKTPRTAVL
ncbi:type IV pilus secretin PilQ [Pandoraea anhela]|uniref:Type IV pilus biogenesis and competence protein PilQ n=1 Tax=Pandoraea anhela TaxID=2508295 RepID=A0A5E4XC72_9BURK|nr:type IV pilus secretin PilQ [Pandoraea anhela]VVE33907.1 Type IV pilus biogenesis and competence protein PilQ [Pandoraea anhela]